MSSAKIRISRDRLNFEGSISRREIKQLLKDKELKVLQTAGYVDERTLGRLNESFFPERPDVKFRVYGFYSEPCDLRFLSSMTNVQKLSADCLHNATGIESIVALRNLKHLGIGIWNLEDLSFLNDVSDEIESLYIGTTKSKKPNLAPLSRFGQMKSIYLEGQKKNIESLAELRKLEKVTLRSITVPDLDLLKPLENLWSLGIKLGGTRNLAAIEGMDRLKYLELWLVRGLSNIGVVESLGGLQFLFLQALKQVTALPSFARQSRLRRIALDTMKGLKDVSSLKYAPALTDYTHVAANNLQVEDYRPLLENKCVKSVRIGFGSDKKNNAFKELLAKYGKEWAEFQKFEFVD